MLSVGWVGASCQDRELVAVEGWGDVVLEEQGEQDVALAVDELEAELKMNFLLYK